MHHPYVVIQEWKIVLRGLDEHEVIFEWPDKKPSIVVSKLEHRAMSTFATVVGVAAAVCTTAANVPQLKKAWTTGQTDDISMNMLWVLASGLAPWGADLVGSCG